MTIAQYKINKYLKENKTTMHALSVKLGYGSNHLNGLMNLDHVPLYPQSKGIEEFFGIVNESDKIPERMIDKYKYIRNVEAMFNITAHDNVHYETVRAWYRGKLPRNGRRIKYLCKILDLRNEWVDGYRS